MPRQYICIILEPLRIVSQCDVYFKKSKENGMKIVYNININVNVL